MSLEQKQKYLSVDEFWKRGYLQEVNRRVLHPLGLALSVTVERDDQSGEISATGFGEIWDERDDPEGIYFAGDYADLAKKAETVESEWDARQPKREAKLGFMVQPLNGGETGS